MTTGELVIARTGDEISFDGDPSLFGRLRQALEGRAMVLINGGMGRDAYRRAVEDAVSGGDFVLRMSSDPADEGHVALAGPTGEDDLLDGRAMLVLEVVLTALEDGEADR